MDKLEAFNVRKAAAVATGWTCDFESGWFIVSSPTETVTLKNGRTVETSLYSWFDRSEYRAWYDLLMDEELYDELTELLGAG